MYSTVWKNEKFSLTKKYFVKSTLARFLLFFTLLIQICQRYNWDTFEIEIYIFQKMCYSRVMLEYRLQIQLSLIEQHNVIDRDALLLRTSIYIIYIKCNYISIYTSTVNLLYLYLYYNSTPSILIEVKKRGGTELQIS